jgi:hypothetical protein
VVNGATWRVRRSASGTRCRSITAKDLETLQARMSSTIHQPARASAHRAYLACALPAIAAYFFSPSDAWLQTAWFVAIGLSGSVAIGVGLRRHRPDARRPGCGSPPFWR